jgi:peptidoglycan/xylan/chitin deacetylase (PgdA/CDA1 family)
MIKIPILAYHSIDDSGSVISITPERFRRQMQFLAEASFNVISLKDVVKHIMEKRLVPEKSLAITFDDGFSNVYGEAYPVLKEYGFNATVFLVPGFCGRDNNWNGQSAGIPVMDLLDWDQVKEMAGGGIDFGAHTMNHPDLSELAPDQAYKEIAESKSEIQKHIGKNVCFFAYPYGSETREIRKVVEEHFEGACSTELGFVTQNSSIYSLPRIEMYYMAKNNLFSWMHKPLFSNYISIRNAFRLVKSKVLFR